ncbi:unnamed protein product [Penicillium salamii]|uniref:MADS-box domain-containing protein n=1 Tax=Penicillium salamii TaxID=1612424 RepID=A0A9W4N287_9EURO|nr:unnamed protein product [Penicillium salamii]
MAATDSSRPQRPTLKRKLMRQKQCRRKSNLMKKACEYSEMCEADVCLGIRLRETGQVFILSADASGFWGFLGSQLNCYYPAPYLITQRDLKTSGKPVVAHPSDKANSQA